MPIVFQESKMPWTAYKVQFGSLYLDLKNGYCQVEPEEASKALTAFTVDPLAFYECKQMPFGLMNTPVMFQHLKETCLGNLQF